MIVAVGTAVVRRWSAANGWNDLHLLALTSGALLGHSLAWGPMQARTTGARVGVAVLFAVTVALLGLLARAVRARAVSGPVAVGTCRRAP
ncbi:hypothetical protein [Actinopolymorpha rutila]|uniref:Uncharacterized protein n=1 Tax=Actinopolymorpha rutila TaxID=446787 RepID=A0A852ZK88_9ACTN|nr:hypothetical protein [Actinopolymorpha rutila]NYH93477.1 hypothetical protein [Actinopolymorpha rutila]